MVWLDQNPASTRTVRGRWRRHGAPGRRARRRSGGRRGGCWLGPCASGRATPHQCRRGWRGSGGSRAPACSRTRHPAWLAVDRTDRRVDVDHQRPIAGSGTRRPGPLENPTDDRFELADMPEREGAQERAQRRRRHHPMRQHPSGGTGTEHVGVIDVAGAGDHRVHQGQHLAAGTGTADPPDQAHRCVDQRLQLEPRRQRGDQQQTGVGDQVRFIEDDIDAVNPCDTRVTGSASWPGCNGDVEHRHCPSSGGLSGGCASRLNPPNRWIEAKLCL